MELEHSFIIPVPPEQAWPVLLDVERIAPCMPGATVDSVDGDVIKGRIKVKVGPVAMTYAGTAHFTERDEQARSITLEASGKETRGAGTASATVRSSLEDEGGQTKVVVHTSMNVTGRPAQFGRGVMAEVSGRIIERFAANLAALLASAPAAERRPTWRQATARGRGGRLRPRGSRGFRRRRLGTGLDRGTQPSRARLQQPAAGGHPHGGRPVRPHRGRSARDREPRPAVGAGDQGAAGRPRPPSCGRRPQRPAAPRRRRRRRGGRRRGHGAARGQRARGQRLGHG